MCGSSSPLRPVSSSDSRMRSSWLDEATRALAVEPRQRLEDAGDRLQLLAEALVDRRAHALQMAVADDQPELVAQHAVDGRHRAAEEALIGDLPR